MKKQKKNLIRQYVKELELQLHGSQDGFGDMEAQLVYNELENFQAEINRRHFEEIEKDIMDCEALKFDKGDVVANLYRKSALDRIIKRFI